ncbi:hypothetical protein [Bosea sp. TAF32]|uniref:hypothetical protein n=1 Tax=Bosea sp. TAF32 TaxID=3237482 RepID=UPI003F91CA79
MTISTAMHSHVEGPGAVRDGGEDSLNAEFEAMLPREPASEARGRWFDLCFRLIILALAALWLLTPPAGGEHSAADEKAVATTQ